VPGITIRVGGAEMTSPGIPMPILTFTSALPGPGTTRMNARKIRKLLNALNNDLFIARSPFMLTLLTPEKNIR
jgi:hypothetical protein